jgi:hypothetical protein
VSRQAGKIEIGLAELGPPAFSSMVVNLKKVMHHLYEDAGFKVAAALRRGGCRGHVARRSEIGSHTLSKTAIFIRRGELEKVMRHFYENGLKGHKKIAQGTAGEKQEPAGDCRPRRPGNKIPK